jgi:hypothetical protein
VEEEARLRSSMQELLRNDRVIVNGRQVAPTVIDVRIEVRGYKRLSSATFHIIIEYDPVEGRNVLEVIYEPTRAEYSYVIDWVVDKCTRIVEVDTDGLVEVTGRTARVRVRKGEKLRGYESLVFEVSRC